MLGSRGDRIEIGRSARRVVPRSSQGDFEPRRERADPVALLAARSAAPPDDPARIRHARMAASPFAFLRDSAAVMAADLSYTPVSGLVVQACGDAHVGNFGVFASPERRTVFDITDFDETSPGPWEWDLKRLVASIDVVARGAGMPSAERERILRAVARSYRERMAGYAEKPVLATWYDHIGAGDVVAAFPKGRQPAVRIALSRSERKTSARAVDRLTEVIDGTRRFRNEPPTLVRLAELDGEAAAAVAVIESYRRSSTADRRALFDRFRFVDAAREVGAGSVGTRAFVALFVGPSGALDDHLVLQVKEARPSVLADHWPSPRPAHHGERVVVGQRVMQAASDVLLGWTTSPAGDPHYVRQLWDTKGSADPEALRADGLSRYGALCAWALARAHARTGDPVSITAYLGGSDRFDRAVAGFASAYGRQTVADHARLLDAIADGELVVAGPTDA